MELSVITVNTGKNNIESDWRKFVQGVRNGVTHTFITPNSVNKPTFILSLSLTHKNLWNYPV